MVRAQRRSGPTAVAPPTHDVSVRCDVSVGYAVAVLTSQSELFQTVLRDKDVWMVAFINGEKGGCPLSITDALVDLCCVIARAVSLT